MLLLLLQIARIFWANTALSGDQTAGTGGQLAAVAAVTPALSPTATATVSATPLPTNTARPTATTVPTPGATTSPRPLVQRFRTQADDRVTWLTPGVVHIRRLTDDPLRINLLLFDLTAPEFDIGVGIGDGWLSGRNRTSYIAQQNEALAAINGDLFSGDGIPQGLTIINGRTVTAPKYRATFAWSTEREPFIGYFTRGWTWQAEVVAPNGERRALTLLNNRCAEGLICIFNSFARVVPERAGAVKVVLDADGTVSEIVRGSRVRLAPGEQVLQGVGAAGVWLRENLAIGDEVQINIATDPPLADFRQAISGGPIILRNGQFVQDCLCALDDCSLTDEPDADLLCEDFSTDWKERHYLWVRMPRTGIGFDRAKQTLIVAVADGYQAGYSRGMTQEEFADLLREFGASEAMELDGGGSTTMLLDGEIVNRPSDETGERYVANALLFFWGERHVRKTFWP